jgi:hypothetical protein
MGTSMRFRLSLCLLTICALTAYTAARASSIVPAIVSRAAQTASLESAGVIVHERHITLTASAGPAHFSQRNDAIMLMNDATYSRIHYLRIEENGHVLNSNEMAKREAENNKELESGKAFFKQPFDQRYLADYQYTIVPCSLCASGEVAVHFSSPIEDEQHGAGDMHIDAATGHVLDLTYAPNALPDHANSGQVSETFGQALPGLWTIVRIDRTYSGRVLFVGGRGTVTEVLDNFHHFTDASLGEAYYRTAMTQ